MFHNFFRPRHSVIPKTYDGTQQNVHLRKGGTKQYMATYVNLYINTCPISVQAYKNIISNILDESIDDEPLCVLRILITKDNILL